MDLCVLPSQVLFLKNVLVPLKYASVSVEYNQIFQSYFGEKGGLLQVFINNSTNMMCSCSEK